MSVRWPCAQVSPEAVWARMPGRCFAESATLLVSAYCHGETTCLQLRAGALHTDEDEGDGRRGHDGAQASAVVH